ncbi:MAG: LysR family transcriptional regulator [Deltaproteobacteria bacterium]|nr:LysR family transcriptional regulator [Deltaproteobacteria bacterium]
MQQQSPLKGDGLGKLAIFAAVAEHRSFSAAAEQLQLPRSSVSRAVAALEDDVGAVLLHRTTRKVALSPAGALLLARIAPGLSSLQAALATPLSDDDDDRGLVRVTAVADFATAVLKDVVAAFVLRWPQIRIELLLSDRVIDLRAEGVDVAFRFSFGRLKGDGLVARKLGDVALALYAAPAYLARAGWPKHVDDLKKHASVGPLSISRLHVRSSDGRRLVDSQPTVVCNEMSACRGLVVAGVGVGWLPSHLVKDDLKSGALVPLLSDWHSARGTCWLVLPQKSVPGRVQRFRDFVVANAAAWF